MAPGMLGPIPVTAMITYCDRYALPAWAIDGLISLDIAWLRSESRRPAPPQPQGLPKMRKRARG